jgi:hypothetical protein
MPVSSYQVERLLDRLRRLGGWATWPAYRRWRGADPVRLSRAAHAAQPEPTPDPPLAPRPVPPLAPRPVPPLAAVRDGRRYPPVVEQERERRAGSFMEPPYPDPPPPGHIPKLGRAPRRPRRQAVAEGD